jgi:hypothetical protein
MNDKKLATAASALAASISNELAALALRRAAPLTEGQQAVATRAASLAAERERRDRAGVRVRASADDLGERTIAHHLDVLNLTVSAMNENSADVGTLTAMLSRAVAMITQMGDALTAPERVAAEAERVAWEASEASRNAPVDPEGYRAYRADRIARGLAV